jgi:carbamoyltransferase
MKILGISAFYHDSAAALVIDGKIISAAQEERFTRKKHTADFPGNAIKFCLHDAGLKIDDLDAVVFYDKPFLKFERLLETYFAFAPKGLISFLKAMPVWLGEKLFLKNAIKKGLSEIQEFDKYKLKLLFTEHHLSHAASAFFVSPFQEAAILTIDGVGEWCTASFGYGEKGKIKFLREMNFPHSVGLLYSSFTYYLGFTVNSGEYKLMGLAPYGNKDSEQVNQFIKLIKTHLVDLKEDGSIFLHQNYFNYSVGLTMTHNEKWEKLFGFRRRNEDVELTQAHCNLALAIQLVTEEIVIKMATELKRITNSENICMAGGVALNCVANGKLQQLHIFKNIFIQPAAGDSGAALGAALAVANMYFNEPRIYAKDADQMHGSYLGPDFSEKEIEIMGKQNSAVYKKYVNFNELTSEIAEKISEGNVVGWFQDRMEFGPRALGNRSILADPRNTEMQKKLNLKIKNREGFRPFAPSALKEYLGEYFENAEDSAYMLFVSKLKEKHHLLLPLDFDRMNMWDKLYCKRSNLQAITHIDFSARVQSIDKINNLKFWNLINEFKQLTGIPMLVNTSFNVRGEPIVCTPDDAYRCFMSTDMDFLVINNFVFEKTKQPNWENKSKWLTKFERD